MNATPRRAPASSSSGSVPLRSSTGSLCAAAAMASMRAASPTGTIWESRMSSASGTLAPPMSASTGTRQGHARSSASPSTQPARSSRNPSRSTGPTDEAPQSAVMGKTSRSTPCRAARSEHSTIWRAVWAKSPARVEICATPILMCSPIVVSRPIVPHGRDTARRTATSRPYGAVAAAATAASTPTKDLLESVLIVSPSSIGSTSTKKPPGRAEGASSRRREA